MLGIVSHQFRNGQLEYNVNNGLENDWTISNSVPEEMVHKYWNDLVFEISEYPNDLDQESIVTYFRSIKYLITQNDVTGDLRIFNSSEARKKQQPIIREKYLDYIEKKFKMSLQ